MSNYYETTALLVEVVGCLVMLWLIRREAKIVKLNINVEGDLIPSSSSPFDQPRFQLIWPRGVKELPSDWDRRLLDAIAGARQFAVTIELRGRKLTCVVDGNYQILARGEKDRIALLTRFNSECCSKFGNGASNVKVVGFACDGKLPQPHSLSDVDAE